MRQRWLMAGCIVCLLLLVATAYAWIASYEKLAVVTSRGKIYLVRLYNPGSLKWIRSDETPSTIKIEYTRISAQKTWQAFGCDYIDAEVFLAVGVSFIYILLPIGFAFAGCMYLLRRQRRRERLGLCMKCGYDLRESPERCPECGTEAKARTREACV